MDETRLNEADKLFVILITDACKTIEKMFGDAICQRLMDEYLIVRDECECPICDCREDCEKISEEEKLRMSREFEEFLKKSAELINFANQMSRK